MKNITKNPYILGMWLFILATILDYIVINQIFIFRTTLLSFLLQTLPEILFGYIYSKKTKEIMPISVREKTVVSRLLLDVLFFVFITDPHNIDWNGIIYTLTSSIWNFAILIILGILFIIVPLKIAVLLKSYLILLGNQIYLKRTNEDLALLEK